MADRSVDARALALLDAALEQDSATREAWVRAQCGEDTVLCDRTLSLLRVGSGVHLIQTGGAHEAVSDPVLPERVGAYKIVELIGQGGMGAVYRGERITGDFHHVAAIKLIRPGALSDPLIDRFQRERQTLASLSHSNIARLFDGGETPAGEPYIIMELVDGAPLGDWLARETPSSTVKIAMFLAICSAVGFAHQNLIVHRDITPSNILVSKNGTPKLIDFGISRPPSSETAGGDGPGAGGMTLTPGFAAPERYAGESATTLSDIYSLGVLLDRLVGEGADADLAAIIACARRTDPAARYPTVDALAADVAAWRDGRVVAARKGGRRYAVGKFVLRHRRSVAAGVTAVALLLGALAATLAANVRAEAARQEAEARFQQTRAIAKTLMFEAYDAVSKVPGATAARALLAETGQTYLLALAAMDDAPLDVQIETGAGFTRLAQVVGGGGDAQLGKLEDAGKLLARAEAILTPLYTANPENPQAMRAYAILLYEQTATALYNDNDPERARVKAARIREVLAPVKAQDVESARLIAGSWQGTGDSYAWTSTFDKARDNYLTADRFIEGLEPEIRDARPVQMVRSANLRLLGEAYHELKDAPAAKAVLERAVAVNRALLAANPDDPALIRKVAISLWYQAVVHRANDRDEAARTSIEESVALARALRQRSNGDATSLQLVALTGEVHAQVLGDLKRYPEAFALGDEVLAAHRAMVALAGEKPGARRSMVAAMQTLGGSHYNGGDYAGACALWREGLDIFLALDKRGELSAFDKDGGLVELKRLLTANCENGPPR
ncbi:serine/threonine-protein kinase, partial [Phenylobacterium sp.]|uniref:serine/threonine-protein kinase n=1 Tax=Phenylobacterium sp. TaxID=1871053 RepID=UPI00286B303E